MIRKMARKGQTQSKTLSVTLALAFGLTAWGQTQGPLGYSVTTPRPMTHDLIKNVLTGLDAQVKKVVVTELRDDTFFAVIWLEREGRIISVDSRPSDALAVALRLDCPIFVDDEVLKTSKVANLISERGTNDELRKWLEGLNDEDLGRYKM